MRAWITGAGGLIGSHLVRLAPTVAPQWQITGLTRKEFDLLDFTALRSAFGRQRPQLVIHCAAVSRSEVCQQDPALARRVNVETTRILTDLASEIPLVFFSSDLVFDGEKGAYVEDDSPNPLSFYAETKVAAEQVVLANPCHTVIRTSLNAGVSPRGDRSFTEEMRRAWQAGRSVRLFTDEFRCPIPAAVTAQAVWALVERRQAGLFHLAGSERLSRWEIGQAVAARYPELNPQMEAGSLRDYIGPRRPADTSLDCGKIQKLLPFPLPGFRQWLAEHREAPV